MVLGAVIGLGILRTPGLIAGYLGRTDVILMAWAVGGGVALLASLVFAELAGMHPEAGGKFVYALEAFGPAAGFVTGWAEILVTRGFSAASKAIVIGEYIILLTGWGALRVWAALVVVGFFLINAAGLRAGRDFQNGVTALKVVLIVLIIGAGLLRPHSADNTNEVVLEHGLLAGFGLAYLAIAFTYYGWDDMLKLAGEFREPGRTLPRVLWVGAVGVSGLYLGINFAFLHALTPAQAAGSPLVAADAVAVVLGEGGRRFITVAALVILVSSLNMQFLGLPRVAYGLAARGLAPRAFLSVSDRGTPLTGLYVVSGFVLIMAMTRSFELLIQYLSLVALIVDGVILIALFRLRHTRPHARRPFRVPGFPWVPGAALVAYAILLVLFFWTQPGLVAGAVMIVAGLAAIGVGWTRRYSVEADG